MKGIVTDIQRTSVHDGPGLRTTVFLKGCNMRCMWCHNPETLKREPEIMYYAEKCIHCGKCAEGCRTGARVVCGKEYGAEEILDIVEEDRVYYGQSGGVTISGGEPSVQPEFLMEIVKEAKRRDIHVGIETNLSMDFNIYKGLLPYIDCWMADIKMYDEDKHQRYTGVSNKRILSNIRNLDDYLNHNLIIRTPVIEGINSDRKDLDSIASFVGGLKNLWYYELLPYHPLGLSKQVEGGMVMKRFEAPDKEKLKETLTDLGKRYGIMVKISNVTV